MTQETIRTAVVVLVMAVSLLGCSLLEWLDTGHHPIMSDGRVELP